MPKKNIVNVLPKGLPKTEKPSVCGLQNGEMKIQKKL